jgi:PmbA protein
MNMSKHLPSGAGCEYRSVRTKASQTQFQGNRFERIDSKDQITQTVRVLHEGKLSVAVGSKPDSGEELLKKAVETVKYGSEHSTPFVGETVIKPMNLTDDAVLSSKEQIDILSGFVADIRAIDERLVVSAGISSDTSEVSLITSSGFNGSYRQTDWSIYGYFDLMQGEDLLTLYDYQVMLGPHFDLKKIIDVLSRKLAYAKNVVPFTPGAYPVVFTPSEVGYIIAPVTASLNGMAVYRQMSRWGDKLGQEMLDPRFTLVDDGTIDRAWTSKPFDSEGTPTRRNVLVQNGVLGELLTDRKTAGLLGKESSGNSAGGSMPAAHSLRLSPGTQALEDMIKSIDYGLIIDGSMGAWSGNPYAGVVTGTVSMGLKVEKGKVVGRVKDCMFTVNAFEHFRSHLAGISSEVKESGSNVLPYVMLDEVVISTK